MGRTLDQIRQDWPFHSKALPWLTLGAAASLCVPHYGILTSEMHLLAFAYGWPNWVPTVAGLTTITAAAPAIAAGFLANSHREAKAPAKKVPGIYMDPLMLEEDSLFTSVLVTGVTGSGKTSRVIIPAAENFFLKYNEESDDPLSKNPFQKAGGFVVDVKGDFVDSIVSIIYRSGRCASRDVVLINPVCRIPVVRFVDDKNRSWYLSARGGATGGSDAGNLLPRLKNPATGKIIPSNVFERPNLLAEVEKFIKEAAFYPKAGPDGTKFIGWRWDGSRLRRVSHTTKGSTAEPLLDDAGNQIFADPPKELRYAGIVNVHNGVQYNLVDNDVPASEAAARLAMVAKMLKGSGGGGGENDYFYDKAKDVITNCISLHRAVHKKECTAQDIVRLSTQQKTLEEELVLLASRISNLHMESSKLPEDQKAEMVRRVITPLEDLSKFFSDEWQLMVKDGKTANIIKSVISMSFGAFIQNPDLADSFCAPRTVNFEDCAQEGKVFILTTGKDYEQQSRMLGCTLKADWQSCLLSRNGRSDINTKRIVIYLADECQRFIFAGSTSAGDTNFMSMSRSNNVFNLCGTQSYAWVLEAIGRTAADVYLTSFGTEYWLQQSDPETKKRASERCGSVTVSKTTSSHDINFHDIVGANGKGAVRHNTSQEDKQMFKPDDFGNLNKWEVIAYCKEKEGKFHKVKKGAGNASKCSHLTSEAGKKECGVWMRQYYCELVENLLFEREQSYRFDLTSDGSIRKGQPAVTAPPRVPEKPKKPEDKPSGGGGGGPATPQKDPRASQPPPPPTAAPKPIPPQSSNPKAPKDPFSSNSPLSNNPDFGRPKLLHTPPIDKKQVGELPKQNPNDLASPSADDSISKGEVDRERQEYRDYLSTFGGLMQSVLVDDTTKLMVFIEQSRLDAGKQGATPEELGNRMLAGPEGTPVGDISNIQPTPVPLKSSSGRSPMEDLAAKLDAQQKHERIRRAAEAQRTNEAAKQRPKLEPDELPGDKLHQLFYGSGIV